jgi:hypothetical protein
MFLEPYAMTARKKQVELIGNIKPDQIYRTTLSPAIFGLGPQATVDKVKSGELPPSFPLSASSRFRAWTGQQILDHRANMMKAVAEEKALAAAKDRQPQPAGLAAAQKKIKKQKLRPPARQRESA